MRLRKVLRTAVLLLLSLSLLAAGCGAGTDLAYSTEPDAPVIVYSSYKAIAPIYNPGVPEDVIYGDGTLIRKRDPYVLLTGKLSQAEVQGILEELDEEGFFGLEESYTNKEPLAGGTTEKITVYLESGAHTVSVEGGTGPPGWGDIVASVAEAQPPDMQEYVPSSLTLFAREAGQVPEGARVDPWPGDPADLAQAASSQKGLVLEGDEAATAWKAVQEEFVASGGGDSYWSAGGKVYTYVYATPILPGVEEGD